MRRILVLPAILVAFAGLMLAQSRTDPSALSGPRWESGKDKSKPRDPNTRNVIGVVRLPDDTPVVNAVVKLRNLKTSQVRSFFTVDGGRYYFYGLSTNIDYELVAEYKGYSSPTRSLSVFDNRLDAVIHLKLEKNKKSEEPASPSETAKAETTKQ